MKAVVAQGWYYVARIRNRELYRREESEWLSKQQPQGETCTFIVAARHGILAQLYRFWWARRLGSVGESPA